MPSNGLSRPLFLLAALALALAAPGAAGARLLKNGSFERGLSGWRAVHSSLAVVHGGKHSRHAVRVAPRKRGGLFVLTSSKTFARTTPDRFYRVGAWLRGRHVRVCLAVREVERTEVVGSARRCLRAGSRWQHGTLGYHAQGRGHLELLVYAKRRTHGQRFFVDRVTLSRTTQTQLVRRKRSTPASTESPRVTGSAIVGGTLLASTGAWTGPAPISFAYQWRRCDASGQACANVWKAVNTTYSPTAADAGRTLRIVVTARNAYGAATATSAATVTVPSVSSPPPAPPLPPPPPSPTSPQSRPDVGVAFHCMWSDYTDQQRTAVLDKLAASGAKWVRIDIGWSSLQEVGRGQLSQWYVNLADRCVDLARARGLNVLGLLFRTPAWANGGQGVQVPPSDPADYAWIAHWAADHFRGRVAAWEVWNEPDPVQADWSWSGTVGQYVQLLQAAYPALKSGDPNAQVLFGGPSWNDIGFIAAAYAAGAKGSFDVMAVHPYQAVANTAPEQTLDKNTWWFSRADAVHDVMAANGDGDKKIWFTEFGWSSHANTVGASNWMLGVTEAQQGDYLVRAIEYARLHFPYVSNMFWYDERNQVGQDIQNANYGLLTYDLAPKPAYNALRAYLTG
jgi:hypothetical protein